MKFPNLSSGGSLSSKREQGFTLAEIMIAMAIFSLILIGIVSANLFGLRMFDLNQTKLNANRWSRQTVEALADEIHTCNSVQVGYLTNSMFVGLLNGETQQCTALQIQPTANPTNYTVYFVNLTDQTFCRTDQSGNTVILADSITNTAPFSAQDFAGNILTNNQNNQVIHIALEFYQPQLYLRSASYYKLETSVKQRVQE
jgi:prepilin-type N-terminal cleavage/methylation domain-containing protein